MEEDLEAHNNYLTQAELFKSYSEQNNLYCNLPPEAMWFEFGGKRIGRMSLEIPQLTAARKQQQMMQKGESQEQIIVEANPFAWRLRGKYRQ